MTVSGPTVLRSGPLSAVLDGCDLVDIRWGGAEVVQRLYVAVRDEVWNTIPARVSACHVDVDSTGAGASFEATHEHGDIAFAWSGTIRVQGDGTLTYEMRGRALSDFAYCKIGFNVHHGLRAHAGRTFRCRTADGEYAGAFGADLQPQLVRDGTLTAMTPHYDRLEVELDGLAVALEFEGDRFEMQDHRNWLDANWKSYGTPLSFGFPMRVTAGTELVQRVTIRVAGPVPAARAELVTATWRGADGVLPRIGHRLVTLPDPGQRDRLRGLRPDHIRVDVHAGAAATTVAAASALADDVASALEAAVFVRPDHAEADAEAAAVALADAAAPVDRVLVLVETSGFSAFGGACPPELAGTVRTALARHGMPSVDVAAGTGQSFVDVNRDRPDYTGVGGVVFAANPQVHMADDRSLMQNVQAIPDVVAFARRLLGDVDVVLSPVDLVGRDGPFPAGPAGPGDPPANEDARQRGRFAAAWTVAALAEMARCRTTSATLFELVGPRGVLDDPDRPYPVARVLEALAPHHEASVPGIAVDDPDRLAVLALATPDGPLLLAANLTPTALGVVLPTGALVELDGYAVVAVADGEMTRIA